MGSGGHTGAGVTRGWGLRGFASLRTRPVAPVSAELLESKRFCSKCGAQLRQTNPGPLCAPCQGRRVEIPAWAALLGSFSDDAYTINTLAAAVSGQHSVADIKRRNAAIRTAYASGEMNKAQLAQHFGLSRSTIRDILAGRQVRH